MKFTIVSNITNGAGLQRDYELLKGMLEAKGHTVHGEMFNSNNPTFWPSDVVVFLEVVDPRWFRPGVQQYWMVPNSEWWYPMWEPFVKRFSKVLCKTKDCLRLWMPKVGARATFMGFEANDFYRPEVERKKIFLHLAGKSETKNTQAVVAAWRQFHLPYQLIISAFKPCIMNLCRNIPNVTLVTRFDETQVRRVMNECRFHIMPSKAEGYGHAIHEALGCGGAVLTTNAPPMNEFAGLDDQLLIPVAQTTPRPPLTLFYEVNAAGVAQAVNRAWQLRDDTLRIISEKARDGFLADRQAFRMAFDKLVMP